jgi:AcrR family transcriptional regulator
MMCDRRDGRCAGRRAAVDAALVLVLVLVPVLAVADEALRTAFGFGAGVAVTVTGTLSVVSLRAEPTTALEASTRTSPAHRPSRRDEIVDAAIAVFAAHGFVDAAISQVAETAGVAVTAVYYHFASKSDLYEAAISRVLRTVDDIVAAVRADDAPGDQETLHRAIDAVWEWVDANPGPATLMSLHTPSATRKAAELRHEFDELHVRRAFAYLDDSPSRSSAAHQAEATLAVRVMIDLLISIHPMRLEGGPLSSYPSAELRKVVKQVSTRLLAVPR